VTQWIRNRSLLATVLMGSVALIFLVCVMAYATTGYFLGQNDAANESRWSADTIDGLNQAATGMRSGVSRFTLAA
jgi:hypothetical protein